MLVHALHPDVLTPNVARDRARGLADLADAHPLSVAVPTCGDWTLADLTWHLAEVQHFWAWAIEHRPAGPESYPEPTRPGDELLADLLRATADRLHLQLADADPDDAAWSWSDDHTVGFTIRRQAHEAVVHHVDGLLAVGASLPQLDPRLAADGIDELVRVMLTGTPDWATFTSADRTIVLTSDDTGDRWPLRFGRMTGTSPDSGTSYDLGALEVIEGVEVSEPTTTVSGPAVALDLWMWGRAPLEALTVTGDSERAQALRDLVIETTQ